MPPSGDRMSTCLSCPFWSFLTFTLHADRRSMAAAMHPRPENRRLVLSMACSSPGDLRGTFESRAPLGHVGNRDRKVATNRNLSEQGFHRCNFGDGRVGKCAD